MKYFITENGLEPFDLTARELLILLLDNIPPDSIQYVNNKSGQKAHFLDDAELLELTQYTLEFLEEYMLSPNALFKHPDMFRKTKLKLSHDVPITIIQGCSSIIEQQNIVYIICSINSADKNSVQLDVTNKGELDRLMRLCTIDSILKDLD